MSNRLCSHSNRRIAERIRRTVTAVEPDLMRPVPVGEADPVVLCQFEAAGGACMGHHLGAWNALRIELVVPGRVERVGPVYALAVAADLDHLGSTGIGLAVRMRCAGCDAADADRPGKPGLAGISDIVLTHLSGAPAGHIEKLVIHG